MPARLFLSVLVVPLSVALCFGQASKKQVREDAKALARFRNQAEADEKPEKEPTRANAVAPTPSKGKKTSRKKAPIEAAPVPPDKEAADAASLKLIKQLIADGKTDTARYRLQKFGEKYPGTKAAEEARKLLERMG